MLNNGQSDRKMNPMDWPSVARDMSTLDIVTVTLDPCQKIAAVVAVVVVAAAVVVVVVEIVAAVAGNNAVVVAAAVAGNIAVVAGGDDTSVAVVVLKVASVYFVSVVELTFAVVVTLTWTFEMDKIAVVVVVVVVVATVAAAVVVVVVGADLVKTSAMVALVASLEELELRMDQGLVELSSGKEYSTVVMMNWVAVEALMVNMVKKKLMMNVATAVVVIVVVAAAVDLEDQGR